VCGIVGLFLKNAELQSQLGMHLERMLIPMSDRGPDSAGIAIYGAAEEDKLKLTVQSGSAADAFPQLQRTLESRFSQAVEFKAIETHAVLQIDKAIANSVREIIRTEFPDMRIMSRGESVEIYKEVGPPADVSRRFGIAQMRGSHGIGHTRMATESAVTTRGAHPFSTGPDQCLVHNGSLSNHNNLRRELRRQGVRFETENDTEVAAAYLSYHIECGLTLGDALEGALKDLDGFYTFVFSTRTGFGVLRDPIACKPAVLAETDDYVAFGSEYRALVALPGIEKATVWEPEPATVYFWEH
jgi:glutamate synthase domain-containing protein 1